MDKLLNAMYATTIPLGVRTVSEVMVVIMILSLQNECNKIINQFETVLLSTAQVNSNKILVVQLAIYIYSSVYSYIQNSFNN